MHCISVLSNILILISAVISALYWFASSCVKIVEPGDTIYSKGPNAQKLANCYGNNICDNKIQKTIFQYIKEIFIQCTHGLREDLCSFLKDHSIEHFFHFHEINSDLFSAIRVSNLLNQRAALFSALTAFFTIISVLIDLI